MAVDAIVVGAEATGIAAARRLTAAGARVVVVEAAGHVGGRTHTVVREGHALDLGAGWLHSGERNPRVGLAAAAGLTIDRTPARWDRQWRDLGFPRAEQAVFGAEVERRARRALAAVVGERLFFAGEAREATDVGTAHGAHATGLRAAEAALAVVRR